MKSSRKTRVMLALAVVFVFTIVSAWAAEMEKININTATAEELAKLERIGLKYFGFTVKQIRVVVDERATREGIVKRLEWLVKDAKPGDGLLFHFSGHGSQIRDRDGDELKDNLDEILCPLKDPRNRLGQTFDQRW